MPTQLYISLEAASEKQHKEINKPLSKNSWEKINETLALLPSLKSRKALRITAIKGINMGNEKEFAKLIEKAVPDFVEIKAYMFVGYSRKRLAIENMPLHSEIKEFAEKINKHLGYCLSGESSPSRVVLLSKKKNPVKIQNKAPLENL